MERPRRAPPQWAGSAPSGRVSEPLVAVAATGFAPGQRPPAQWWNYQFNQLGQWVGYLAGPSLTAWTSHELSDPADDAEYAHLGVDRTTEDDDQARYRYAIATEDSTGPMVLVSRRGTEWVTRRNLGATPGTPQGIVCAHQWVLWTDTKSFITPRDIPGGESACALRTPGTDWTDLGVVVSDVTVVSAATPFAVGASASVIRTLSGGSWSAGVAPAGRETGRAVCYVRGTVNLDDPYILVDLSSNSGNGVIHRCVGNPDVLGNWTLVQTLTGTGSATTWRLAVGRITNPTDGNVPAVVAYKRGEASPHVHVSKDDGVTWSAVTTAGLTGVLRLAWDDGVWIATTLYAPYVLTSSDLETWTAVPVPVPDDTAAAVAHDAAVAGGAWLVVRRRDVLRGAPAIAPDTAPWTPSTQASVPGNAGWLRGRRIAATAPTDGQALVWDASGGVWVPETPLAADPTGTATTTDTSWTTALAYELGGAGRVAAVQIRAAAVTDDGTAGAAWVGTVMARRPSAGAVVVGTAVWLLSDADGAGWEVRVVSDGADGLEVQVRGDPSPATELRWRVTATITEAS